MLQILNNRLPHIPFDYIDGFKMLALINIWDALLAQPPNFSPIQYTLAIISLRRNIIANIDTLYGVYMPKLTHLDLSAAYGFGRNC